MNPFGLANVVADTGTRFRTVSLLPAVALGLFVVALVATGAPSSAPSTDEMATRLEDLTGWEVLGIVLVTLVGALVLEPLQISLVRVLEGYWGSSRIGTAVARPGKAIHRWRCGRLDVRQRRDQSGPRHDHSRERAALRRRLYPPKDRILPTRLGNVLRAGEIRAGERYQLDAVVFWPRLYPLLTSTTRAIADDRRDQLDLSARFSVVFVLAAAISLPFVIPHGWWLILPTASLLLAWASYRSAVSAAAAYGEAIAAAFDLHRFDLLEALHLPLPCTLTEELRANEQLSKWFRQPSENVYRLLATGEGINFAYAHHDDVKSGAAADVQETPPSA